MGGMTEQRRKGCNMTTELTVVELTQDEIQVLQLIADGCVGKELQNTLFVSASTCKRTMRSMKEKLGAQTNAHAVSIGIKKALIHL